MVTHIPRVGAPDPELNTSPIFDEYEEFSLDQEVESRGPFEHVSVAAHVRDLERVDIALVCVPAGQVLGIAREILQQRLPVIECAIFEEGAPEAHYRALGEAARHHHVTAGRRRLGIRIGAIGMEADA